ncbi:MAG: heavy metal translocating P-type ATPase, partial [Mailhella sp.]
MGILQLLLSGIIMVINQKFFVSGFKSLWHLAPNMDTLVAIGSAASFGYSVYALFAMSDAQMKGDMMAVHNYAHEFYFESAAMILTLITVGKMLEARSKGKTTNALKSLMRLSPKTAVIEKDGVETEVPVETVRIGDIFVVRPGESIPVDGVVVEGSSAINESALTGESIPVDKEPGSMVSAATINQSGFLRCEATRVGEDTTLSQIIKMVSDAAATKAPIAKVADRVSGVFVPAVIAIAFITVAAWLLAGQTFGFALARGISVLVISCPCALGLATPVAIMVGNGVAAGKGVLFKTAVSLEEAGKVQIAALDKTGTITKGEPRVTDIIPAVGFSEERLLEIALALEKKSEHPLAKAILEKAGELGRQAKEVQDFQVHAGNGLSGLLYGEKVCGGSMKYIGEILRESESETADDVTVRTEELAEQGKTPLLFTAGGKLAGIIAVADIIKEDSAE